MPTFIHSPHCLIIHITRELHRLTIQITPASGRGQGGGQVTEINQPKLGSQPLYNVGQALRSTPVCKVGEAQRGRSPL